MKTKGELIRHLRERRGWNEERLAKEISKLHGRSASQQSINHYETGKTTNPRFLAEMCQVFGITLKQLRTGDIAPLEVRQDRASYTIGPKGLELTQHIQSGRISEDVVAAMWPMIELLKGE